MRAGPGSDSPWDDAERRPSHANKRKALRQQILRQQILRQQILRQQILRNEFSTLQITWRLPRKIIALAKRLIALAA